MFFRKFYVKRRVRQYIEAYKHKKQFLNSDHEINNTLLITWIINLKMFADVENAEKYVQDVFKDKVLTIKDVCRFCISLELPYYDFSTLCNSKKHFFQEYIKRSEELDLLIDDSNTG